MIRVYYLDTIIINQTEVVVGSEYIHQAILSVEGTLRKLIQDTTDVEHSALASLAESWRDATPQEIAALDALPAVPPPDPDYIRACEILGSSPDVITQPEIWELLRLIGRRLGYHFD